MADILEIIIKWAIPFILSTAASAAIAYTKALRKKHTEREEEINKRIKALEDGVQSLLRSEIMRVHDKYSGPGYCPQYEKDALELAYKAYHALGGNDIATKLYNDVIKLPETEQKE